MQPASRFSTRDCRPHRSHLYKERKGGRQVCGAGRRPVCPRTLCLRIWDLSRPGFKSKAPCSRKEREKDGAPGRTESRSRSLWFCVVYSDSIPSVPYGRRRHNSSLFTPQIIALR